VAYSLRQLSTTYTGSVIKVRRSSDNAEANVAFDATLTPPALSSASIATLLPGVVVSASLGTNCTGNISSVAAKTGTISVTITKTGTISIPINTSVVTGNGTTFGTDVVVGDIIYRSSDYALIGVVKSIASATSLTLLNNSNIGINNLALKQKMQL
jgi:hypothetical protein